MFQRAISNAACWDHVDPVCECVRHPRSQEHPLPFPSYASPPPPLLLIGHVVLGWHQKPNEKAATPHVDTRASTRSGLENVTLPSPPLPMRFPVAPGPRSVLIGQPLYPLADRLEGFRI